MIDLHLHLDGSLSEQDFIYLAKKDNISLGDDFPNNIYVPADCPSLADYLKRFDLPCRLLQTKENLIYATKSLIIRLYNLGLIYVEIRFAPQLHTLKGLTQMEVTRSVIRGLKEGLKECPGFDANIILCCMRHADEKINMETIEVANKLKGDKVCGVDLAGDEVLHPSSYYKNVFELAKKYKLNITIHAGEATGSEEIMLAIDNGAKRIGHGVHLSLDSETIQRVKENDICFEFCPTSNLQTKSLTSYKNVPLKEFIKHEIKVTINSDNMTVSNTDVNREMKIMINTFKLSKEEVEILLLNSINSSFTNLKTKRILKEKLNEIIDKYYSKMFEI